MKILAIFLVFFISQPSWGIGDTEYSPLADGIYECGDEDKKYSAKDDDEEWHFLDCVYMAWDCEWLAWDCGYDYYKSEYRGRHCGSRVRYRHDCYGSN